jgi:hypothetical protein
MVSYQNIMEKFRKEMEDEFHATKEKEFAKILKEKLRKECRRDMWNEVEELNRKEWIVEKAKRTQALQALVEKEMRPIILAAVRGEERGILREEVLNNHSSANSN